MNPAENPCEIFFHLPKTGGQTFHNLISRQYRGELVLNTHCGLLTTQAWQNFIRKQSPVQPRPSYRAVMGHMKFGVHEMLPGPSRYVTFLRDPAKRFASYYYMLRSMGHVPAKHRFNLDRPDWNLPVHETLPRELDNGQTRALADADWDLPFGQCTEAHLQTAMANLDRYFGFVGVTEQFDLSLMVLTRLYGWRWHFFVSKNVTPSQTEDKLSPEVLEAISGLNRFDRQLHAYACERLAATVRRYGMRLQMEHRAYAACNAVHRCIHHLSYPLKQKMKQAQKTEARAAGVAVSPQIHPKFHEATALNKP